MKQMIGFAAVLMAAGLLAGCSRNGETGQTTAAQTTAAQENQTQTVAEQTDTTLTNQEETELEETEASEMGGKTLVVYFSASGHTEDVAGYIADSTGGELFELEPVEPYTSGDLNWSDSNSRVSVEHENPDQRKVELVKDAVEDWDEYDTVFIGYPIWWGIAAWPVNGFIEANDFTGKNVIPFCTSSSSGLGDSGKLLAELAGTGDWQEGMRFNSSVSEEDVVAWVESLGFN